LTRSPPSPAAATAEAFKDEIVPVALPDGGEHRVDETVRAGTTVEGLAELGSAFTDSSAST